LLAALAGRIYDHAPQQNANPLGLESGMWILSESEPTPAEGVEAIWQRLAETILWCAPRANRTEPSTCLRSADIRPRTLQPSYSAGVNDVAANRRLCLRQRVDPRRDLAGGRILVYGPDEELSDGAAEAETAGYLDVNNCPPWDTWISLTQFSDGASGRAAHLFSWVPPVFLDDVQRGIEVNPEQCIMWLEDWQAPGDSALIQALRTTSNR
jgi:hypothetical protein